MNHQAAVQEHSQAHPPATDLNALRYLAGFDLLGKRRELLC